MQVVVPSVSRAATLHGRAATVTVDTTTRNGAVLAMDTSDNSVGDTQVYTQDLAKANAEADAIVHRNLGVDH